MLGLFLLTNAMLEIMLKTVRIIYHKILTKMASGFSSCPLTIDFSRMVAGKSDGTTLAFI